MANKRIKYIIEAFEEFYNDLRMDLTNFKYILERLKNINKKRKDKNNKKK